MTLSKLLRLPARAFSHFLLDRSYQKYYSAEIWDRKYAQEQYDLSAPIEDARYGALTALLRRYDRGGPILDAGCGDGLLELRYRPLSDSRLVGIDYAQAAIETARGRNLANTEFHAADFSRLPVTGPFSVIVFNEALYYVEKYMEILGSLEGALKPEGVFVISMFDTVVTARIWKTLRQRYRPLQTAHVKDGQSGRKWTISVFPRPDAH